MVALGLHSIPFALNPNFQLIERGLPHEAASPVSHAVVLKLRKS